MDTTAANGSEGTASRDDSSQVPATTRGGAVTPGNITQQAAKHMHRAASALRDKATRQEGRMTRMTDNAAAAIDQAAEYVDTASFTAMKQSASDVIRRYPFQALAAGLGVGFIAARLLRR